MSGLRYQKCYNNPRVVTILVKIMKEFLKVLLASCATMCFAKSGVGLVCASEVQKDKDQFKTCIETNINTSSSVKNQQEKNLINQKSLGAQTHLDVAFSKDFPNFIIGNLMFIQKALPNPCSSNDVDDEYQLDGFIKSNIFNNIQKNVQMNRIYRKFDLINSFKEHNNLKKLFYSGKLTVVDIKIFSGLKEAGIIWILGKIAIGVGSPHLVDTIVFNTLFDHGIPKIWITEDIQWFVSNKKYIWCFEVLRTKLFEENSLLSIFEFNKENNEFLIGYCKDLVKIAKNAEELNKFISFLLKKTSVEKKILLDITKLVEDKISELNKRSNDAAIKNAMNFV